MEIKNFLKLISITVILVFLWWLKEISFSHNNIIFMENWKIFLVFLVFLLFLIILTLMIEDNFDVYLLYLLVLIGSLIIICCDHLLIIYLGLELQTFSLFVLIAKNKSSIKGSEAGLKYFILGAISSGLYLLGLCFLFLFGISLNLKLLMINLDNSLVILSLTLILLSFGFKLGLSPFHFWLPDIYEGSSWDVISLISSIPKLSVLSIFIQIIINSNLILFVSLISIIIGTLGALNQTKLKRLLAYSSISHMGFIVLGYSLLNLIGYEISFIYLFIYMITSISLFIIILKTPLLKDYYIIELSGLQYINKTLSLTWLIIFLSIAGIPPLSGFISKWFILWNTITSNFIFSSIIIILFSMIGAAYYLRVVKILYFQKQASYLTWTKVLNYKHKKENYNSFFLGWVIFFSIFFILNPDPFLVYINYILFYFF